MNYVAIEKSGDYPHFYISSIYAGEAEPPKIEEGTLVEDIEKILLEHGYSKIENIKVLSCVDDFYCNDEDPEKRKDDRHRVSKGWGDDIYDRDYL